jgi:hypothetical protein
MRTMRKHAVREAMMTQCMSWKKKETGGNERIGQESRPGGRSRVYARRILPDGKIVRERVSENELP